MNNDYLDPINAENMPFMADSAFALDFLLSAKIGVQQLAMALSETATDEVRTVLRRQLTAALALHKEIQELMMEKGWFHPYALDTQFLLDMTSSETVAKIAGWKLFPEDTTRRGLFATPNK